MKTFLISLLILTSITAQAGAPIFAKLQLNGVTRNMTLVNPRFKAITSANVSFNEKSLSLTLNKAMPQCAAGMMCIQVMPAPLNIKLDVVKVERTKCAVVYTAQTPANVKSTLSEVVTVEDYTNSTCSVTVESVGLITYQVTGTSSLTKQKETATANLLVDGEFIRALN